MSFDFRAALRVLGKEIREASRDRNLVVNLVLVPVFLYPLLGFGAFQVMQIVQGISERNPPVIATLGPVPSAVVDSLAVGGRGLVEPPAEAVAALRRGEPEAFRAWRLDADERSEPAPDALLVWTTAEPRAAGSARSDSAAIWFDRSRDRSVEAKEAVEAAIEDWRREFALAELGTVGLGEADLDPWPIEEENTASASQLGQWFLSLLLPMILLLMLAMGTFYSALDAVVGERERGTLETLLVSPLRRGEIVLGKYLWVLSASVLTLLLNLASMAIFLGFVVSLVDFGEEITVGIPLPAFGLILVTAVLTAGLLSAVLMVAALPARSYREGQATLTPLYLLTLVPGLVVATSAEPFTPAQALVPLLNSTALFEAALKGEATAGPVAITWIVLAAVTAAALLVASRIVAREDVYLENDLSLRQLLGGGGGRKR